MIDIRQRRREFTADEIERVAIELFAVRGFDTVTVDEIAEAAGISARTFFRYFPTKAHVVRAHQRRLRRPPRESARRPARRRGSRHGDARGVARHVVDARGGPAADRARRPGALDRRGIRRQRRRVRRRPHRRARRHGGRARRARSGE